MIRAPHPSDRPACSIACTNETRCTSEGCEQRLRSPPNCEPALACGAYAACAGACAPQDARCLGSCTAQFQAVAPGTFPLHECWEAQQALAEPGRNPFGFWVPRGGQGAAAFFSLDGAPLPPSDDVDAAVPPPFYAGGAPRCPPAT